MTSHLDPINLSEASDHLNLAHLDDMTGGDNHLRADILGFFSENAGHYIAELRLLAKASPPCADAFRAMAHKLKGAARAIGAYKISGLAQKCEDMSDAPNTEKQAAVLELQQMLSAIDHIAAGFSASE